MARLRDRVGRCCGRNAGDDRHTAGRCFDGRTHNGTALLGVEVREFAGRAERRQAMDTGTDKIVGQPAKHIGLDAAGLIGRRDEIRKHAVKIGHSLLWSMIGARLAPGLDPNVDPVAPRCRVRP
jgi:hypothetical protein